MDIIYFMTMMLLIGKSWGLKEFLDTYDKKLIIVGIECNHEGQKRLSEYCPYQIESKYFGHLNWNKERLLMDWVVNELKDSRRSKVSHLSVS